MVFTLTGFPAFLGILIRLSWEDSEDCFLENRTLFLLILVSILNGLIRWHLGLWNDLIESGFYEIMLAILFHFTKGKLGEGDLIVLAVFPFSLSNQEIWMSLLSSGLLLFPTAILIWILEKDTRQAIPFLPFLTAGIILTKLDLLLS